MTRWCRAAVLAVSIACPACGDDKETIPDGFERVTGSERIGWNQQAGNAEELAGIRYLVHVDGGTGAEAQGLMCGSSAGPAGFECSSRLPDLTAGRHALAVSAFIESGGQRLASPPSEPLNVYMVGRASALLATGSQSATSSPRTVTTVDGASMTAQVVADDLDEPTDLAFTSDGAAFIAERKGRVRIFRPGRMTPTLALMLPDVVTIGDAGLLALAVDPRFDRTAFVYLVYTSATGFRIARFRAVGDSLADRAILLDGVPYSAAHPSATLRFGPDGRLYVGLDDGGDARNSGDLGTYNGKVLRLNPDATTPDDQAGFSPIYAAGVEGPSGLEWDVSGHTLWVTDRSGELQAVAAAGDPATRTRSGKTAVRYTIPDGTTPRGLALYRSDALRALGGDLLVAADAGDSSHVLRITVDAAEPAKVVRTERLLLGSLDAARAIAVSPDGAIYLCTRTSLMTLGPGSAK